VQELLRVIGRMVADGSVAVILVEQHAHQILPITKQALVLERGHVVHQGPSDVLAANLGLLDRWLGVASH
jgi:branched-chain amino acid transport system ATP-binding protein